MTVTIEPEREYIPSEIAKYGFIPSQLDKPMLIRQVQRIIRSGKLPAKEYVANPKYKSYKVLGKDIIEYVKQSEEKKKAKKKK